MDEEEPLVIEFGEKTTPGTTLTWLSGRDELDGARIDRYCASDGYVYGRMVPPGGGYCPELQGIVAGRAPGWTRIPPEHKP